MKSLADRSLNEKGNITRSKTRTKPTKKSLTRNLKGVSGGVRSPGKSRGTVKTEDKLDLLGDKSRQIKPKENLDEYEFISS